jgi:antitoxin HigA-1
MGKSQAEFADELGWTKAKLNELIRGKRGISASSALDLAEALGTSAKLLMNFQSTWDLDQAFKKRLAYLAPITISVCISDTNSILFEFTESIFRAGTLSPREARKSSYFFE